MLVRLRNGSVPTCTSCHTETETADRTCCLPQSQSTDTGPTSPSADPMAPGVDINSQLISGDNGKVSVMMGTLLSVFGSCKRHFKLKEEMQILLRPIPKEDTLRG